MHAYKTGMSNHFPKWLDLDRQPHDPCRVPPIGPIGVRSDGAAFQLKLEKLMARCLSCRSALTPFNGR